MPINLYKAQFNSYFNSTVFEHQLKDAIDFFKEKKRQIFFIGNGGSNSICSHMMEDFAKIAGFKTFSFSDPAFITCFANDYGYEKAMEEWLKIYFQEDDLLVAISSSGSSKNILNAVDLARERNGKIITLSGFKENNPLSQKGDINFYIGVSSYGVVECFHQIILHIIVDSLHVSQ